MSTKEADVFPVAPPPKVPTSTLSPYATGIAPLAIVQSADHIKCLERVETAIGAHNHIKKVLDEIDNLGCKLPENFFVCRTCEYEMTGGFLLPKKGATKYNPKIIMCEDKKIDKRMFQNTLLHELIHAYDICRAKIDVNNCKHYACTEIRASALSGECNIMREVYRGKFNYNKGHQVCVKRRASLSLALSGVCKEFCDQDVEAAFKDCYNDVAPFYEHH